eukprot:4731999-Pyramimonas_sp.AAC.1
MRGSIWEKSVAGNLAAPPDLPPALRERIRIGVGRETGRPMLIGDSARKDLAIPQAPGSRQFAKADYPDVHG